MKLNLDNIPITAGVYIMKNKKGKIIYIGKAKNLKKRVSSYFNGSHNRKTMELVRNIDDIEYFLCNTEIEALILENNLIKKHVPKYNILLKDQKTYPYIKITKEEFPRISIARKVSNDAYYFGPYPNVNMKIILNYLIKVFRIRDCKINVYKENKRPCLKYHMNLCNAPCVFKNIETKEEYDKNVKDILNFLQNKSLNILKDVEDKMQYYSSKEDFENAIIEREKIKNLKKLIEFQITEMTRDKDEDVFYFDFEENYTYLCVLNVRDGKLIGKDVRKLKNVFNKESIDTLIALYYEDIKVPKNIIISKEYENLKDVLIKWFNKEKNTKVNISFPKQGRKYKLLELSCLNLLSEKQNGYKKI